jgi:LmbE family N-acetylglucosaminyl deacetylase
MFNLHLPTAAPLRILCVGAHSDDIEIGCGGTLLTLLERYECLSVKWVVFSGSAIRAAEAQASAERFLERTGERQIDVLGFRDGFFPAQFSEIKEHFETLKFFRPDVVFTHYRDDRHQDHRVLSDLAWNTFRDHTILEYEIPKYDGDFGQPNVFVPLAPKVAQRKTDILLSAFASQRGKAWFDEQTFLAVLRLRGMECAAPSRFAEAFYGRKMTIG